jgi:hypothetical protein
MPTTGPYVEVCTYRPRPGVFEIKTPPPPPPPPPLPLPSRHSVCPAGGFSLALQESSRTGRAARASTRSSLAAWSHRLVEERSSPASLLLMTGKIIRFDPDARVAHFAPPVPCACATAGTPPSADSRKSTLLTHALRLLAFLLSTAMIYGRCFLAPTPRRPALRCVGSEGSLSFYIVFMRSLVAGVAGHYE